MCCRDALLRACIAPHIALCSNECIPQPHTTLYCAVLLLCMLCTLFRLSSLLAHPHEPMHIYCSI